jgi:lipid II:glycine glycyltransferase (peptidoglycan interpeptide bridge formation enzyme)
MYRYPTDAMTVAFSQSLADPDWDAFLESTGLGQYQQSSMWARYKASDGWHSLRYLFTIRNRIIGGFQMLCKETRYGRIGYIPKGPVVPDVTSVSYEEAIDAMVRATYEHDLRALIAQPPDECIGAADILKRKGFLGSPMLDVIDATLLIPLSNDFNIVMQRMDPETRRKIRQARKNNMSIREGDKEDLPIFFDLMATTCRRQSTTPNPSSLLLLQSLWEAFRPGNHIDIAFAVHNEDFLAGVLCINFGNRVTLWKKGWSESGGEFRPNDFIHEYAISRAHQNKFSIFDFAGLDREIAHSLLTGNPLNNSQKKSRDIFNLRFGGAPQLLPHGTIYIKSKILNYAFQLINNNYLANIIKF